MQINGAGGALGSVGMVVVGCVVAAVTVIGLISSQTDSAGDNPANSSNPTIDYGAVTQ